jgi:hypothetical protein
MANKDLFKQAIAEAKSVREAAIANAKEALEETLTPHLKDMLAAKLQEMEDSTVEEEVVNESSEEVEEAVETTEEGKKSEDDTMEEGSHDKEEKDEAIEENDGLTTVGEAEEDEAEDDSEESEDDAEEIEDAGDDMEAEEEIDGDEDLSKLSVDQFKDMIRDIISQEVGGDAPADDMDAGDIEGMGDEMGAEEIPGDDIEAGAEDDEIDLDELIRELDSITEEEVEEGKKKDDDTMEEGEKVEEETVEEDVTAASTANQESADHSAEGTNINRTVNEESSELEQAMETIETLKKELNEVNILNAKLLYVNKIFKAQNLSESQKVNVIAAFDKAETVKEVKLVFETVSDNVGSKKETTIKEHKGSASKATGTTASKPEQIVLSEAVLRMQKLAGIIK